jgi:fermentation-respiration switch protein FrsA (DUF1100 family)
MKKWQKRTASALCALILVVVGIVVVMSYHQAQAFVQPIRVNVALPSDYGLEVESVALTTSDGLKLAAWYIPSRNGAAVILQHGYGASRLDVIDPAKWLATRGYGVLMADYRASGMSEGDRFSFGKNEVRDIEAAYQYVVGRPDVDAQRVGAWGISMGGVLVLLHAAQNREIRAVLADCPFASLQDELETGVKKITGLPPFPFASLIQFFLERELGFPLSAIAPIKQIRSISPRPVFLLSAGKDTFVPPDSGQRLYDAAGEPRQLWFDPDLEHCEFWNSRRGEFEKRVAAFFDQYLLGT